MKIITSQSYDQKKAAAKRCACWHWCCFGDNYALKDGDMFWSDDGAV